MIEENTTVAGSTVNNENTTGETAGEQNVNTSVKSTDELGDLEKPNPLDAYVFMDDVKKVLDVSFNTEKNVILYGPGGYGKSEYALDYLGVKGISPYVITMGSGMTTDRLFGGLDILTFNATGKVEYLVDNSFMNFEYVIFEELFDAPDYILEQLKDILSSGVFRNGGQVFPIKTKNIICCTNKTREEFSKNNSLKALMERFPLELKVVWKEHTRHNYEKLFMAKFGGADPMLTYLLEAYHTGGTTISPRIALTAASIIAESGPESLNFIADFSGKPDLLKTSITKFNSILEIKKKTAHMLDIIRKFDAADMNLTTGLQEAAKLNKSLYIEITALKAIKADDSLISTTTDAIKKFTLIYEKNKKTLDLLVNISDAAESFGGGPVNGGPVEEPETTQPDGLSF